MNWIDLIVLVVLVICLLWGMRTGLIKAGFGALGVLIGWWLAGRYAPDVGGLAGDSALIDTIATVGAYVVIMIVMMIVVQMVGGVIKPFLVIGTLGTAGMADRIGGLALGLLMGLLISGALVLLIIRVAFNFTVTTPDVTVPGVNVTVLEGGEEVAAIEDKRDALIQSLDESKSAPFLVSAKNAIPGNLLGLISDDFKAGLEILESEIGEE